MISRLRQLAWHWRHWRQLQSLECSVALLHERLKRVEYALQIESRDAKLQDEILRSKRTN